jgi:DNA mismatch endonuclease (patch repair protein)
MMRNRRVKRGLRRTDNLTPKERRKAMRAVRGRHTTPERRVGSILREMGVRFRAQAGDLPGRPDFVLPGLRAALFVQGCFWHGHACRPGTPRTNRAYWLAKLARNRRRDRRARRSLNRLGWTVVIVWECHVQGHERAVAAIARALVRASAPTAVGRRSGR